MNQPRHDREKVGKAILDAAFRIHTQLGPGLLESAYEACLVYELEKLGFKVDRQLPVSLIYGEVKLDTAFRIDVMVEDLVIIEVKTVESLAPVHEAQLLTYMRLSGVSLGYILNFYVSRMKDGIKRMIL
ncbi:MAG: GxxExxY protein [Bacteroidia bacterium]|nr:GxxExxY protein [Bacteroidia bacterium]